MSRNSSGAQALLKITQKLSGTLTVTNATNLLTLAAHGYSNGDKVRLTAGVMPTGLAASTDYYVRNATTNTFQVSLTFDGDIVEFSTDGTAVVVWLYAKQFLATDYRHLVLDFHTSGSANVTLKVQGSNQKDVNFANAQSPTNKYTYLQIKNTEDGNSLDGDTGIVLSGTDINKSYAVNTDNIYWIGIEISSWVAGSVNIDASGDDNE